MRILAGSAQPAAGPRLTPAPARFHTVVGVPATIALQYPTGKPVKSRYSGQMEMMYTLTTGEKAYFPMEVGQEIDALTLAPGQPFTICHHGGGSWEVERAYQPPTPQPPPQRPPAPPAPYPPAAQAPARKMNGAGQTATEILLGLYPDAIEVALKGAALAQAKGLMVVPTFEDVRTIATTLFLNQIEGSR